MLEPVVGLPVKNTLICSFEQNCPFRINFIHFFFAFLVHLSRRLKCTIVIMRCPSSVVNFSHFRLLLWYRWTEFNETWQEARSQSPLPSVCFSGWYEEQDGRPGLWLAETFSTSLPIPLNGIQQNLTRSKISTSSTCTNFVFFRADQKNKMATPASDWLRHFRLLLLTQFKETWQEARSQGPQPSLCFSGRSEKQDGRPASDWLRHFRLLLWNRWAEFKETWQEARSQRPLPSLCFSGRSEK